MLTDLVQHDATGGAHIQALDDSLQQDVGTHLTPLNREWADASPFVAEADGQCRVCDAVSLVKNTNRASLHVRRCDDRNEAVLLQMRAALFGGLERLDDASLDSKAKSRVQLWLRPDVLTVVRQHSLR